MRRDRSSKQLLVNWVKGPIQMVERQHGPAHIQLYSVHATQVLSPFFLLLFISLFPLLFHSVALSREHGELAKKCAMRVNGKKRTSATRVEEGFS